MVIELRMSRCGVYCMFYSSEWRFWSYRVPLLLWVVSRAVLEINCVDVIQLLRWKRRNNKDVKSSNTFYSPSIQPFPGSTRSFLDLEPYLT